MIMPKRNWGGRYELPDLDPFQVYAKNRVNFWITDEGDLLTCSDHEVEAREYIIKNNLLLDCADWMKYTTYNYPDYRSFVIFSKNWIRLTVGESTSDGFGITVCNKISRKAFDAFTKYLNTSFTDYCMVDTCFEDNYPELSVTYSAKQFSTMISQLKKRVEND